MQTLEKETLAESLIAQIEPLYFQSRMLHVWELLQPLPPLTTWTGVQSRLWAGRLASNLGSQRLASVLHRRNHRRHPQDFAAAIFYAHSLLNDRGPLRAREFLEALPEPAGHLSPEIIQYYYTLRAMVAAEFRDFPTAEAHLKRAANFPFNLPWYEITHACILEKQDRYGEALEIARHSLRDNPHYRPGIQITAHLLQILDRDEEALAFLRTVAQHTQSSPICATLACLEMDLGLIAEALASLDRVEELSPLADRGFRLWLHRNRATLACRAGDLARARNDCARVLALSRNRDAYHRALAVRLDQPDPPRRRRCLAVNFIRQHHKTCAPATLAALAQYWHQPVEHLELAEAICYDGTPSHSQRRWADNQGFITREFTVTWEAAVALIDRGMPFALTTVEVNSSHLQAVVGYDELRQCLLLRDPFYYYLSEARCPQFLEAYAAFGPHGLVLLPAAEAGRLEGLELPDCDRYDQVHAIYCALKKHQREQALAVLETMCRTAADHWLTCAAGWAIAAYDAHPATSLQWIERWLTHFPRNARLRRIKLDILETLSTRQERLAYLEQTVNDGPTEPLFQARLAAELQNDGRELPQARHLIRRALRRCPTDPDQLKILADILWIEGHIAQASDIYRLAACAAQHNEFFAEIFFYSLLHLRQAEAGLAFLRARFEALSQRSSAPAITLFKCLTSVGRTEEGFAVLAQASQRRPDDGELRLFFADALARAGRPAPALEWLEQARDKVHPTDWLRVAAQLAAYQADLKQALKHWKEVLKTEPLALDAHQHVHQLLAETRKPAIGHAYLNAMCRRFPSHCGLLRLRAESLSQEPLEVAEPALRELLDANPVDTDARRDLAMRYADAGRHAQALAEAECAIALDPLNTKGYAVRAYILLQLGRREEARADYQHALRLDINNGYAMGQLVQLAATDPERLAALDFIQAELVRQVVFDEALPAFRNVAHGLLPPEQVLFRLREAFAARPDLWAAWLVVVVQLCNMDRLDEALELARQACDRFPLIPRLWLELARILCLRCDHAAASEAVERALTINPCYGEAVHFLAELHAKNGDLPQAIQVLERGLAHAPLDAQLHAALAVNLWHTNQPDAAIARAQAALYLDPHISRARNLLQFAAQQRHQPHLAEDVARELTRRRPGDPLVWLALADCLAEQRDAACLAAAD